MNIVMKYKDYHAMVDYDSENNIYVGEVLGITDSLNFHGETINEAEKMFHQSIERYLNICAQYRKEPNKEKI